MQEPPLNIEQAMQDFAGGAEAGVEEAAARYAAQIADQVNLGEMNLEKINEIMNQAQIPQTFKEPVYRQLQAMQKTEDTKRGLAQAELFPEDPERKKTTLALQQILEKYGYPNSLTEAQIPHFKKDVQTVIDQAQEDGLKPDTIDQILNGLKLNFNRVPS